MSKFPSDAPKRKVVGAFEKLGFVILRKHEHIAMIRQNADGTKTPLTLPNHKKIKGSTLRSACSQVKVDREDFLEAYTKS